MSIPQPPPELDREFFYLLGKIAFIHAGIEQDMKDTLIVDWEFKESKIEKLYGSQLRLGFLEKIKDSQIPDIYYQEFSALMERFYQSSDKRNNLLKATYGYFAETNEIYKYDLKLMRRNRQNDNIQGGKKDWMQFINFEELKILINELNSIREINFQLCKTMHLGKINKARKLKMLGIRVPNEAIKNIYKYIQSLGERNTNATK